MISGYVQLPAGQAYAFDYRRGPLPLTGEQPFVAMPEAAQRSPMSLWNLALETHTGRLYRPFLRNAQLLCTVRYLRTA